MAAAASHSNKTAWHLTSRFDRYLSSSHTIRMIYQLSYTSVLSQTVQRLMLSKGEKRAKFYHITVNLQYC